MNFGLQAEQGPRGAHDALLGQHEHVRLQGAPAGRQGLCNVMKNISIRIKILVIQNSHIQIFQIL